MAYAAFVCTLFQPGRRHLEKLWLNFLNTVQIGLHQKAVNALRNYEPLGEANMEERGINGNGRGYIRH